MELFAIFQTLLFRSSNLSTDLVLNTNEISAGHYLLINFMLFLSKKSFILFFFFLLIFFIFHITTTI